MKAIVISILYAALCSAAFASPIAASGAGSSTCGQWIDAHKPPKPTDQKVEVDDLGTVTVQAALLDQWVFGFVTSVNQFAPHSNDGHIQNGIDEGSMLKFVSVYCAGHPLEPVLTASARLILALRRIDHDVDPLQDLPEK